MNKPTRRKSASLDIPPDIADRPRFKKLTPDEEQDFAREQAEFEAAYRRTGHPLALWEAVRHVERCGQTVPHWLAIPLFEVVVERVTTDDEARRYRERWTHARRYERVHELRQTVNERTGKKYTKAEALEQVAEEQGEGVTYRTIERSYDMVNKDLKRRGRESEYYFFVAKEE
jgi:hypothetical protein